MTDTEAQLSASDPSASQPTPAPIGQQPVSELPEDAIEAATEGAARFHYEAFRAVQAAVGAPNPVPYEELSERTRRIQKDQVRDAATAALAAALPFLERATRDKIAAEIETHAGALVDVPGHSLPVREGVKVWPERQAGGYTQAIGEVLDLIRVARGGEATE